MNITDEAVEAVAKVLVEDGAFGVPWGDASDDDRAEMVGKARVILGAAIPFLPCCKGCPDCKGIIGETGIL